jgi:hypothetical protein
MKPNKRKDDFEGGFSYELVRFSGNGVVTVIVLLLLLPKTPSMLCIAPGTHIAVESMYALCCSKPTISHQSVNPHGNGFVAVEDCLNCTDFFIESDARSAALDSFRCIAPEQSSSATRENCIPANALPLIHRSSSSWNTSEGCSIASPSPLRC